MYNHVCFSIYSLTYVQSWDILIFTLVFARELRRREGVPVCILKEKRRE